MKWNVLEVIIGSHKSISFPKKNTFKRKRKHLQLKDIIVYLEIFWQECEENQNVIQRKWKC
jgi:hypothetical protein